MTRKEAARERLQLRRARLGRVDSLAQIIHDSEMERTYDALGWMLGISFGLMFFLGVVA